MATSISHRATGIALYSGYAVLTIWLISAALGEGPYDAVTGFLGSPIGLLILVGYTWAQMYHLSNGIRHLIWDSGHMLSREQGKISAWTVYASSVVLTILIWIAAFTMGG
jgi:succinate dehydrogenase / fumarate reductase cytochrome b subunit